jgi:hypothetical protein
MKRLSLLSALLVLFVAGEDLFAQTFSVQGVLRDPMGRTVDDGSYNLTFKIYNVETGGNALWSENQASVPVQHGVFGVELGIVTALNGLTFGEPYWLGVTVVGGPEMAPRFKLAANPYSLSVMGAENRMPSKGNVGVGTANPIRQLHVAAPGYVELVMESTDGQADWRKWNLVAGPGGGQPTDLFLRVLNDAGNAAVRDVMYWRHDGNVGVGTVNPQARLSLGGDGGGQKLLVFDNGNARYGFGIGDWEMRGFAQEGGHISFGHIGTDGTTWSEKMRMDAAGNLGIGTPAPIRDLHVAAGNYAQMVLEATDNQANWRKWNFMVGAGAGQPANMWLRILNDDGSASSRDVMYWENSGYVGIGTTAPGFGLDVEKVRGNTAAKFGPTLPVYVVHSHPNIGFNAYYDGGWKFGAGSASKHAGSIGFDPDLGDFTITTSLAAGNADEPVTVQEVMRIKQDGKVGIGTVSPSDKLTVNGNVKIASGRLIFPDGSSFTSAQMGGTASGVNNPTGDAVVTASGAVHVEKFLAARGGMVDISNPADPVTSVGLNLGNQNGNWHFSGPRSYEAGNNLSIYWNPSAGVYHRRLMITDGGLIGINTANPEATLDVNGTIIHRGMDFMLGRGDVSRGDSGLSRALVKDNGNLLHINYAGDFTGGTMLGGNQVYVPGNLIIGNTSAINSGITMGYGGQYRIIPTIPGNDDMQMTFFVHDDPVFYLRRNYNSAVDYAYFDGKVGIGTESPSTDLMVGNAYTKTSDSFITLASDGDNLYRQGIRMIHHGEGDANQFGSYMMASDVDDKLRIGSYFSGAAEIDRIVMRNDNGYVGIGTSDPTRKLHLYGGRLGLDSPFAEQSSGISFLGGGAEAAVLYRMHNTNNIAMYGNGAARNIMTWNTTTGNIGIGTDNPGGLFYVKAPDDANDPTTSGIFVESTGNVADNDDASVIVRAANGGGDPYIGFDIKDRGGWSIGLDNGGDDYTALKFANVWNDPGAARMSLHESGNLWIAGVLTQASDRRLKKDIGTIDSPLSKVMGMRGVGFNWREREFDNRKFDPDRQIGFIAQELKEVLPEAVSEGEDGYYSVSTSTVVPVLVEAMKEQQGQIEKLKSENDALKAKLARFETTLGRLEAMLEEGDGDMQKAEFRAQDGEFEAGDTE